MKVIFFGTPDFAAKVLSDLFDAGIHVVAVISKPDRPKGRSLRLVATPVKVVSQTRHPTIPVFQPNIVSDPEFSGILKAFDPDLFVVVAYGEIIKQHLLDMPRLGCINLHASLLPKYRGAAPIQRAIINGEIETGVTIMHMVRKMDAGDMIRTVEVPIGPEETFGELEAKLCAVGSPALIQVIHDLEAGTAKEIPQDHSKATLAPKIELEDCQIDWKLSAASIHNLVRGVNPYPGAWCFFKIREVCKRLKINRTHIVYDLNGQPGEILNYDKRGFIIACGENALQILELQPEGKKSMKAEEFMHGFLKNNLNFLPINF